MARLRNPRQPLRNDTSRREWRRLLILVFALGGVVLLICESGKPSNWRWLWRTSAGVVITEPLSATANDQDQFAARQAAEAATNSDLSREGLFPGVRRDYLEAVQDNTVLFRTVEAPAWFNLFEVLASSEMVRWEDASLGQVGYAQLHDQSEFYRGRVVTVQGEARRSLFVSARKNVFGIEGYYQTVLRPENGPNSPLIVYSLQLPDGFPVGEAIQQPVTVTGFFLKNWAYSTGHDIFSAPLIVSRTLHWSKPLVVENRLPSTGWLVGLVVGTAILGALITGWVCWRSGKVAAGVREPLDREVQVITLPDRLDPQLVDELGRLADES